ncbi:ABC transporter permease subunit [Mycoplasmatota bacterium]|nr:ABC transporter permease subunit [Mycoplasmatota bacterium]
MIIFKHTFKRMLTLKFLIIYFIIFIPIFLGFTALFNIDMKNVSSYIIMRDHYLSNFFIVTFMWSLGLPFLITTASRGSALIQKEIDDDTLVLLVSKPINRKRIYLEKWLASFAISTIIGLLSIFLSLTLYIIVFKIDSMILLMFISLIPSLIIYILFINFVLTSLSMFVTALFKHRTRSVITLVIFIMIFQLILPIFKPLLIQSRVYEKYFVYLYDLNYHFGIIYYSIINLFSTVSFSPFTQIKIAQFVGIFSTGFNGYDMDRDLGFLPDHFQALNYINPIFVFIFWILLSSLFMWLCYRILKNTDIG